MKKFLIALLLVTPFALSACQDSWQQDVSYLTEDQVANYEQRIKDAEAALKVDDSIEQQFEIGFSYQMLGDYKKAVKNYEKVLELNVDHLATLNNLANIYEDLEMYEESAEQIMRLYELRPESAAVLKDAIRILLKNNDLPHAEEALTYYRNSLTEPDEADIAFINEMQKDIDEYSAQQH